MRPYTHFSHTERDSIEEFLIAGKRPAEIARALKRHPSSVYREIKRNRMPRQYRARIANADAKKRRTNQHAAKMTHELWQIIGDRLKESDSPAAIAGRMRTEGFDGVCGQTIYNHIRKGSRISDFYTLCLRRKGKKYRRKVPDDAENRGFLRIHDIPNFLLKKRKPQLWEGDLVEGKINTGYIVTFVERYSRFTLATKIERKTTEQFNHAARNLFAEIDNDKLCGILYDRGTEMSAYRDLAQVLACPIYFCDPGSPWQRGLNENTNGLLREWFTKGSSFSAVTAEMVDARTQTLNRRPRRALNYRTPEEVFFNSPFALRFGM